MNLLAGNRVANQRPGDHEPKTALIVAAMSDVPNVSLYEATTRGFHAACQKPLQPIVVLLITSAPSGISTTRLR